MPEHTELVRYEVILDSSIDDDLSRGFEGTIKRLVYKSSAYLLGEEMHEELTGCGE